MNAKHACAHNHQTCLKRVPIFENLSDEELDKVASLIIRKNYPKGNRFYLEGSYPEYFVIVNKGKVKAVRTNNEGKEQVAYIFSEGDFFGVMNLLYRCESRFTLEAMENVGLCTIHRDDFERMLLEHPGISIKIIKELCGRLDKMETLVHNIGVRDTDIRICMMILEFARKFGRESAEGIMIDLPLSREAMANYIGVTRETVCRKFTTLQAEGIIKILKGRKIILVEKDKLESLVFGTKVRNRYPYTYP